MRQIVVSVTQRVPTDGLQPTTGQGNSSRPMRQRLLTSIVVGLATMACDRQPSSKPSRPSTDVADAARPADGSTLKIDPPQLVSPGDGAQINGQDVLRFNLSNVRGRYVQFRVTYDVEVANLGGDIVARYQFSQDASATRTSFRVPDRLPPGQPLTWRARARHDVAVGPWSKPSTFRLLQYVDTDAGGSLPPGSSKAITARIRAQGFEDDCTGRATWTVTPSDVASVIGGQLVAQRLGHAYVRASCDGIVASVPRDVRVLGPVREVWTGVHRETGCEPVFGANIFGLNCPSELRLSSFQLQLMELGSEVSGVANGFGQGLGGVFMRGTMSSSGVFSLRGSRVECGLGSADDLTRWQDWEIIENRVRVTVSWVSSFLVPTCLALDVAPTQRHVMHGALENMQR
jgi:hypothetical protein